MALRLIEMVLPEGEEKAAEVLLKDAPIMHFWHARGAVIGPCGGNSFFSEGLEVTDVDSIRAVMILIT